MEGNQRYSVSTRYIALAIFVLAFFAIIPAFTSAQEDQLDATIRTILLSDPNSASLSEAELQALTTKLAEKARQNGVTLGDIVWRPETPITEEEAAAYKCGKVPAFLCALNEAFGFSGDDLTLPIAFFMTSILLLLLLGMMINHYKKKLTPPPTSAFSNSNSV